MKLLLDETQPPPTFGQYDQYLIIHQLAKLSELKLKPILDDNQWNQMQGQFNQARGMEQFLIQNGLLPKDDIENNFPIPRIDPSIEIVADAESPENVGSGKQPEEKSVPCPDE